MAKHPPRQVGGGSGLLQHDPVGTVPEINPFVGQRMSCWEWTKIIIMSVLMIPLIRLVFALLILLTSAVWAKLVLCGFEVHASDGTGDVPLPRWRRNLLLPVRLSFRLLMLCCGFYWIRVKQPLQKQPVAPIMVLNHISIFDPVPMFFWDLPMMVAKEDIAGYPLVGALLRATQPIFVPRGTGTDGAAARQRVAQSIVDRTQSGKFPPLLIFPEGTTTNGQAIVSFKPGAFRPGLPVQPIIVRYPHWFADVSWPPPVGMMFLMYRMLCQIWNSMTVEYLPVYNPSAAEIADANLYARNVRQVMAEAMGVPVTRHSVEDVIMMNVARSMHVKLPSSLRMLDFQEDMHTGMSSVSELLKAFRKADKDGNSRLDEHEFAFALGMDLDEHAQLLFHMMDLDDNGSLDFREFVLGVLFHKNSSKIHYRQKLEMAFTIYDQDNDGHITREEFLQLMHRAEPHLSDDELRVREEQIFRDFDTNSDNVIDFGEFEAIVSRYPEYLQFAHDALIPLHQLPLLKPEPKAAPAEAAPAEETQRLYQTEDEQPQERIAEP